MSGVPTRRAVPGQLSHTAVSTYDDGRPGEELAGGEFESMKQVLLRISYSCDAGCGRGTSMGKERLPSATSRSPSVPMPYVHF